MKRKKYGKCAICGKNTKLSEDHIPPKCCGNDVDSYYVQYTPDFLGTGVAKKPIHSQGGLKFSNICESCNNRMGHEYDTHLQGFKECILSLVDNKKCNNSFDLEKACKSIIGHFLAAACYDPSTFATAMRQYYLNGDKSIYKKYSLICAYYPYENCIFSLNDYVTINCCNDNIPNGMLSSLYFYPFAFIFCEKQNIDIGTDVFELCKNRNLLFKVSSNDWVNKPANWPAVVDDGHAVLCSALMNNSKYKVDLKEYTKGFQKTIYVKG